MADYPFNETPVHLVDGVPDITGLSPAAKQQLANIRTLAHRPNQPKDFNPASISAVNLFALKHPLISDGRRLSLSDARERWATYIVSSK